MSKESDMFSLSCATSSIFLKKAERNLIFDIEKSCSKIDKMLSNSSSCSSVSNANISERFLFSLSNLLLLLLSIPLFAVSHTLLRHLRTQRFLDIIRGSVYIVFNIFAIKRCFLPKFESLIGKRVFFCVER